MCTFSLGGNQWNFQKGSACTSIRPVIKILSWTIFSLHHFKMILPSRHCKGWPVEVGNCTRVMKLVAMSVYKQKPTTSQFGGGYPLPIELLEQFWVEIIGITRLKLLFWLFLATKTLCGITSSHPTKSETHWHQCWNIFTTWQ